MEITFSKNIDAILKVIDRTPQKIISQAGGRMPLTMDLAAADGVNGNAPIDWDSLLVADDFNFVHDVGGIVRHINRSTGKLENQFRPRHCINARH